MKKKKIAFVMEGAIVGGVESSMTELLKAIDTQKYDITLFTNKYGNSCVGNIPDEVIVKFTDDHSLKKDFYKSLKRLRLFRAIYILGCYLLVRASKSESMKAKYACKPFVLSTELFDYAVAYKHGCVSVVETLFHIHAEKRAVWIHGDLVFDAVPEDQYFEWLSKFDKVFCVSDWTRTIFEEKCPDSVQKVEMFYNLLDVKGILEKASENVQFEKNAKYTLVTVGRLSEIKGQDLIPKTTRLLLDAGYDIQWCVIGDGLFRQTLEDEIRKYKVEENVVLLGTKSNPFPYMKMCDVYVQTSRSEGWCLTTQEASILLKPIVTTDLPVMHEQFEHLENGIIVDEISSEGLFRGIKLLLDHPELRKKLSKNLEKKNHSREDQLQKLYDFFDS